MKLEKFKEKDHKRIGIIVFTITCIFLVSGVVLYRTFAIFEVKTNQNVINGTVEDPGNIYFAFYVDNNIQKDMPQIGSGYILDEDVSYCGISGQEDEKIHVSLTEDYTVHVSGMTSSRTKCNLYFVRGAFILGKPIKAVTSGDGLYEVPHGEEVSGTLNDKGFKQTEWRYAGVSPNNYVTFNNEKWRIIGLVNVMTDDNNTVEQRVKIVRADSIGNFEWDTNHSNDWTKSTLMTHLNSAYFNTLNENIQSMIDSNIIWNLGAWNTIYVKTEEVYNYERRPNNNEYPNTWPLAGETDNKAKIGLMNPSDYGYTVGGDSRSCIKDKKLYDKSEDDYRMCKDNNWLYSGSSEWLLTPTIYEEEYSDGTAFYVNEKGFFDSNFGYNKLAVRPVIYLSSNVKILSDGQDGSENKPYTLSL